MEMRLMPLDKQVALCKHLDFIHHIKKTIPTSFSPHS